MVTRHWQTAIFGVHSSAKNEQGERMKYVHRITLLLLRLRAVSVPSGAMSSNRALLQLDQISGQQQEIRSAKSSAGTGRYKDMPPRTRKTELLAKQGPAADDDRDGSSDPDELTNDQRTEAIQHARMDRSDHQQRATDERMVVHSRKRRDRQSNRKSPSVCKTKPTSADRTKQDVRRSRSPEQARRDELARERSGIDGVPGRIAGQAGRLWRLAAGTSDINETTRWKSRTRLNGSRRCQQCGG